MVSACAIGAATAAADSYDDAAADCNPTLEQPFAAWGDTASYFLLKNGSFESGAADWGLTGGATTIDEPEPPWLDSTGDASALSVPRGSSATSSPVCLTSEMPALRFFTRNNGANGARLRVDIVFKGWNGKLASLPVGLIAGGTTWAPSAPLRLLLTPIAAISKASPLGVSFRFTAVTGSWKIDRVYLDPLKECC